MDALNTLRVLPQRLRGFNDRPAIVAFTKEGKVTWSYAALADQAERLAAGLSKAGVKKGDAVALWAPHGPEWIAACLGIVAGGGVAVPLDAQLDDKSLKHELHDSGARYVFT